jgi:hypothetical protein
MVGFVADMNRTGTIKNHEIICFYAEKDKNHLYEN